MAEIDSLEIRIQAQATKANDAIDKLDDKLERLERALSSLNKVNIANFANGVDKLSKAMVSMNQVKTTDFTRLAKNLANLSTVNVAGLNSSASAVIMLSKAFGQLSTATQNANNIAIFANALSKLGNKSVQNAIINIPRLSYSMRLLFENLSTLPTVNRNIIDMTNALANLASQGSKVGSASNSIVSGLNKTNTAMARTTKQATSLASAFGKFYASYFLIIRGVKNLWKSIESSMDYVETYNYFNVALNKIGEDTASMFGEYGKDSAERYAEEFGNRLNELNEKMTGYIVGDDGALQLAGDMGLGLNIQQLMNFQAKVLSVTNSVGLMGEASTSAAKAVSMLAGDYSSLTNVPVEQIMEKLTSGMLGQSRALYSLGIDITNNTLQQYAYAEGIEKAVSEMTQSEKMQLRLLAILDQSEVAWGDLANTVDSVANQYRVFQMQIKNLGRTFGNLFLPIITNVLPYVNGLVIALNNLFTSLGFSMYGDTWLSDLQDGISGSVQGDIGELEDGLEDANDSAKKLKKSLSSFDELEVISINGVSNAQDADEVIDLTGSIADALKDYETQWNKAFENAESKASQFAESLTKIFAEANAVEGFGELVDSVKEFADVVTPFTQGFGDGFVNFFGELSEITLDAFTKSLDFLGDILEDVDPETLEKLGSAIGSFGGSLVGFLVAETVASKVANSIKTIVTAITSHPIIAAAGALTTFVGGLISYSNALEDATAEQAQEDAKALADQLVELNGVFDTIDGTMSDITVKRDGVVEALEDYFNLLGDNSVDFDKKKNSLQRYVEYITSQFPETSKYVNEHTGLFTANKEEILANIDAVTEYAKTVAAQELLTDAYKEYYESLAEYKKLYEEYVAVSNDYNSKYDYNKIFKSKEQREAEKELGKAYRAYIEYQEEMLAAQEKLKQIEELNAELTESYKPLDDSVNETKDSIIGLNDGVKDSNMLLWAMSHDIVPNLAKEFNLVTGEAEKVEISLEGISKEVENLSNKEVVIPVSLSIDKGMKNLFSQVSVQAYSVGGFPEDGLFMANHNELVGKFSNGKTAVANNQQIVDGIKQGVYEAVVSAMGTTKSDSGDVVVNMDGREVFRVVRARANEYYNVNGKAAFNF